MRRLIRNAMLVGTAGIALAAVWPFAARPFAVESLARRPQLRDGALELVLKSDKTSYRLGEQPVFTATLTNTTNAPIALVRPLDGSERGRYPQAVFNVAPPADALPKPGLFMCGNTNPITSSAFFRLDPGKPVELKVFLLPNELDRGQGVYTVQLTYSTDSNDPAAWLGGPLGPADQERLLHVIGPRLKAVPRVTVASNAIAITLASTYRSPIEALRHGDSSEARWALRTLAGAAPSPEVTSAIVEALYNESARDRQPDLALYEMAMPVLVQHATSEDMDRLWNRFTADRASGHQGRIEAAHRTEDLLTMALRFPGDKREERLRTLLLYTENKGSEACCVDLTPEIIEQVGQAEGEDIDRVLRDRFEYSLAVGRIGWNSFVALRDVLIRRGAVTKDELQDARPAGL